MIDGTEEEFEFDVERRMYAMRVDAEASRRLRRGTNDRLGRAVDAAPKQREVHDYLTANGPSCINEIAHGLARNRSKVRNSLASLQRMGLVTEVDAPASGPAHSRYFAVVAPMPSEPVADPDSTDCQVLREIARQCGMHGATYPGEIALAMGANRSLVHRATQRLLAAGLIEPSEGDRADVPPNARLITVTQATYVQLTSCGAES